MRFVPNTLRGKGRARLDVTAQGIPEILLISFGAVSTAVQDVTGQTPRSFGQFVHDYRQAFLQ